MTEAGWEAWCPSGQELGAARAAASEFGRLLAELARGSLRVAPGPAGGGEGAGPLAGDPLVLNAFLALCAAAACWVWYLATHNCSHVDRMWSIMPAIYLAVFAREEWGALLSALAGPGSAGPLAARLAAGLAAADQRLLLASALSCVWGSRLTYNFWRKGGYRLSFEDYRWAEVRKLMSRPVFELFNLVFVAAAQHTLCLLITAPAYVEYARKRAGAAPTGRLQQLGAADWAAAGAFLLLLAGEMVADGQQWRFQSRKHALLAAGQPRSGDYRRGFLTHGLFRYSRHPAFFCEYAMWWALYALCAALPARCGLGWAAAGPVGLTALFHGGSIWITERISLAKYPAYAVYQATTSGIVPWWPGPELRDRGE